MLYVVAGLCGLPVVWPRIRLGDLVVHALTREVPLGSVYSRYARAWFWLGVPAFTAMVLVFALMVLEPV